MDDIITMLKRRTLDISACIFPVQVSYNNVTSPVSNFLDYVKLYSPNEVLISDDDTKSKGSKNNINLDNIFYSKVNDRWEVALKLSQTGTFEHMAFVNSIWTSRGGSHVVLVTNQLVTAIVETLDKRNIKCTSAAIKNKLMLFVKCSVENPSFDSQSKETLTSRPNTFGSDCILPKAFIKQFIKDSGIIEILISDVLSKEQNKLIKASKSSKKNLSQVVDVPKLEDAHFAGIVILLLLFILFRIINIFI
jgi:DNA topoisomerase-2